MGSSSPQLKTAIITGGCSGIVCRKLLLPLSSKPLACALADISQGLAEVKHLLDKSSPRWRVVVADINDSGYETIKADLDPERHLFVKTDVASWESNAALFAKAYEWSNQRIDFFHGTLWSNLC